MTNTNNYNFSGVDTVALAQKYGTPLYVMSEDIIRDRINSVRKSFLAKNPGSKAFYASKAFLTLRMCRILAEENIGLDAVSGGELYTALKAGMDPDNIVFHGNNKTQLELTTAIAESVGKIVVDSISELELLQELATAAQKQVTFMIRINPSIDANTHKYMNTGKSDTKFGIPMFQVKDALEKIKDSQNMKYAGLHFHLGSQLFDSNIYLIALEKAYNLIKEIKSNLDMDTDILDIGGGFGVDYLDGSNSVDFPVFIDIIMDKFRKLFDGSGLKTPAVYIEPGRWITADAGITLYTVGVVKEIPNVRTYVSIDGGMPDNIRPALYGAKYSAVVANKPDLPAENTVTIAGKCCETGDILINDIELPLLERGDYLAVLNTGAYTYSMSSNYNMLTRPALVFIKDGQDELSVRRQTYEDLLALEVLPGNC